MNKLLLLHGALGSDHQTQRLFEVLRKRYEVLRLEFRGHGKRSSKDCSFNLNLLADDVLEFIARNQIEGIDIFGYSMGGYVATIASMKRPEAIGKVVALGTKWHWDSDSTDSEIAKLDPEIISDKVPNFARYLQMQHGESNWKHLLKATAEMMTGLGKRGLALGMPELKNIDTPFLVLRGENDNMVSQEESKWAADSLVNAEYLDVPGQPHPLEKVDPITLETIIDSFLRR